MSKFLIIEEPADDRSVFHNFAIIGGKDEEEVRSKYLDNIDLDFDQSDLIIFNIDEIDEDYYHYLEIDIE